MAWVRNILLIVPILAATVVGGGLVAIDRTLPPTDATVAIPGLSAPVSVSFDRYGIPRIRARTDADAAAALGFVHARDRLMQMDLMRRATGGELAEWFGPAALGLDSYARILGTRLAADRAVRGLPASTRLLLDAYSRGVNAFIDANGRYAAPEYLVLGRPRPWTPTDSMLWAEAMGLYLSDNLDVELGRLALSPHLDRRAILALWPAERDVPATSTAMLDPAGAAALARATRALVPTFPDPFTLPKDASNEWAVDGSRSSTGAPLLAGDPHLSYALPCLWYLAREDVAGRTLAGATAPGVPFMVIGRNSRIAWTFTTTGADTEDVFVEREIDKDHYATPTGPRAFGIRDERIHVRGRPDVVVHVRTTRHGPVISDLPAVFGIPPAASGTALSVEIASLADGNMSAAGLDMLDHAASVADAGRAAPVLTAPVQNLLVADRHHIGLFTTGIVPIRASGDGAFPAPGWDGRADWTGFASGSALPNIVDPPSGTLVNANEPVTGTGSTVFLARDIFAPWRARRLHTLLQDPNARFRVDDFAAMQGDVRSDYAAALLPSLLATPAQDETSSEALRLLAGWDGAMEADRPEPLIFDAWMAEIGRALGRRDGDPALLATAPYGFSFHALTDPDHAACGGDCRLILASTLHLALQKLQVQYGHDATRWRWGKVHQAVFANPVWNQVPLLRSFVRGSLAVGGDGTTVDAQAIGARGFASIHGAAYRGVYDLANLDRSRFVIATGESGNPFSNHLLDLAHRWQRIASITLGPEAGDVTARLILQPGG